MTSIGLFQCSITNTYWSFVLYSYSLTIALVHAGDAWQDMRSTLDQAFSHDCIAHSMEHITQYVSLMCMYMCAYITALII